MWKEAMVINIWHAVILFVFVISLPRTKSESNQHEITPEELNRLFAEIKTYGSQLQDKILVLHSVEQRISIIEGEHRAIITRFSMLIESLQYTVSKRLQAMDEQLKQFNATFNNISWDSLMTRLKGQKNPLYFNQPSGPGRPGPRGLPGTPGIQGQKGNTGAPGPAGVRGPTGLRGRKGEMGNIGPKGDRGLQGISGPPGYPGYGFKGDKGSKGSRGEKGDTGDRGYPGLQGR